MTDKERALRLAWQIYHSCMDSSGCPQYKIGDVISVLSTPEPNIEAHGVDLVTDSVAAKHINFKVVAAKSKFGVALERIEGENSDRNAEI